VDKAALKELTDSIKAQGVLVPLLVRPVDKLTAKVVHHAQAQIYEVVCGSRRHSAAKEAGLAAVPVRICDFTDEQVMEIQIIENLQRQDVHPLDEAQGYARLMKNGRYDATGLAAKVGRSEGYVYRRLKLCMLIEPAQKALWGEQINVAHAELIARLQPADQKKVLDFATTRTNCTAAVLEHYIAENVLLRLREAPFDKKHAALVPGAGPCTSCPKRTSAAPLLFPEVGRDDRCTDPACWTAKIEAHIEQALAQGDGDSKPLRLSEEYSYGQVKDTGIVQAGKWREIGRKAGRCEHARKGVIVKGHGRGKVMTVCAEPKCKVHHRGTGGYRRSPEDLAAEKKRKLEARIDAEVDKRVRAAIAKQTRDPVSVVELRLIGTSIAQRLWHEHAKALCKRYALEPPKKANWNALDYSEALAQRLGTLKRYEVGPAVMELALAQMVGEELLKVAPQWDINPAEIRKAVTAELTPKPKPEGKGKGKPTAKSGHGEKAAKRPSKSGRRTL